MRLRNIPADHVVDSGTMNRITATFFVVAGALLAGCSTIRDYPSQAAGFYPDYQHGRLDAANRYLGKMTKRRANSTDAALWWLECGASRRAAGDFEGSNAAFEQAAALIDSFDDRASVSVRDLGNNLAGIMTNPNAIPYQGYAYDRIMLHTYKALNYLCLGQPDGARVELRRAYQRQKDAVDRYQSAIHGAESDAADQQHVAPTIMKNPNYREQLGLKRSPTELTAFADFVNPFTVYLDGVVFSTTSSDPSDIERARIDFDRVAAMIGSNTHIDQDIEATAARLSGAPLDPVVYLIAEVGSAPRREEVRIDVPVPAHNVSHVGVAFPKLHFSRSPHMPLVVLSGDRELARTTMVSDMDSIISAEFEQWMRIATARTVAATAAKVAAQIEMERQAGALGQIGATLFSILMNRADQRSWLTLPKAFHVARFTKPDRGAIAIHGPGGAKKTTVTIPEAEAVLVYVRILEDHTIMFTHIMVLR